MNGYPPPPQRGEKLRDNDLPGAPAWPANLRTELTRPVVVYGIGPDGATQYPPADVAAGDGAKRPLNEQEKVRRGGRRVAQLGCRLGGWAGGAPSRRWGAGGGGAGRAAPRGGWG